MINMSRLARHTAVIKWKWKIVKITKRHYVISTVIWLIKMKGAIKYEDCHGNNHLFGSKYWFALALVYNCALQCFHARVLLVYI